MEKKRNSGLELARIVCMLLVIALHYGVHGEYGVLTSADVGGNMFFVQAISMFGRMACSVFVLISGYFLVDKTSVDRVKYALVIFDVAFFTTVIGIFIQAAGIAHVTPFGLVRSGMTWYVVYYLIFSLFAPYLNRLLSTLDKKSFQMLLALMFIFWSVVPTLTFQQIDFGELDFFIVMYTVGAYIRRFVHGQVRYKNRWNLVVCLCASAFSVLSVAALDALSKVTGSAFFMENACYLREYNMIPSVIIAVSLFLFFSNLTFSSRPINYVAGSMLHVLIIHMNVYMRRWIWQGLYPNKAYADWPYLHAPVKILCVFTVCLLISMIYRATVRKWAGKALGRWKLLSGER